MIITIHSVSGPPSIASLKYTFIYSLCNLFSRPKSAKPVLEKGNVNVSSQDTIPTTSEDEKPRRPVSRQSKPKHHITSKGHDSLSSFPEEKVKAEVKPPWEMLSTFGAKPPRALTVTNVTQNNDLQVLLLLLCTRVNLHD